MAEHTHLDALGDNASISAPIAADLWDERHIRLLTVPRRNQARQLPDAVRRVLNGARQFVEAVNDQLDAQFYIETNHAHTFAGICARLYTKLTAHTLCLYLNRLLGAVNFLQIKAWTFPN